MSERILSLLSSLPGVVTAAFIRREDIARIQASIDDGEKRQFIPLKNLGMHEVLCRDKIAVILKDSAFRPPPCPTVYMVEETEKEKLPSHALLQIAAKSYYIVGEEVMNGRRDYIEEHIFFEDDFVLFPERRKGREHIPAFFCLPPIPFPELERQKERLGIDNVVSVSPGTKSDDLIRAAYGFSTTPDYATILIGWD